MDYKTYLNLSERLGNLSYTEDEQVYSYYMQNILPLEKKLRTHCLHLLMVNQLLIIDSNIEIKKIAGMKTLTSILRH